MIEHLLIQDNCNCLTSVCIVLNTVELDLHRILFLPLYVAYFIAQYTLQVI